MPLLTPGADPGRIVAERQVQPRETDLFMFSAATWLTHRIHFDRDYARAEGHPDLVIHGPLQGAYLAELLSGIADDHGGQLASLSYRVHRSAYCGDRLSLRATVLEARLSRSKPDQGVVISLVEVLNQNGEVAMSLKPISLMRCRPRD